LKYLNTSPKCWNYAGGHFSLMTDMTYRVGII
jgi:hypothetical protein